jgi:hypothetical protein
MWALIVFVVMIIIFSSFTVSITGDGGSSSSANLGLINNRVSGVDSIPMITSLFKSNTKNKTHLGTPQGAKFYSPKCG